MQALSHLRVLELSNDIAAAYGGKLFAAWGADVICLEPPDGSPLRQREPRVTAPNGEMVSMVWEYVAAGKKSSAFDVAGLSQASLLDDADVFVTDWRWDDLAAAGLDPESLAKSHPRLIVLSLSAFGRKGPYANFADDELIIESLAGYVHTNGTPGRTPIKAAGYQALYTAGLSAFCGVLAALQERRHSGCGQIVEVSCLEAFMSVLPLLRREFSGVDAVRQDGTLPGFFIFECSDGYVTLPPSTRQGRFEAIAIGLGVDPQDLPPSLREPDVATDAAREFMAERTRTMTVQQVYAAFEKTRILGEVVQTPLNLVESEHLAARDFFQVLPHAALGQISLLGPPAKFSETPMQPLSPAPASPASGPATWEPRLQNAESKAAPLEHRAPPLGGVRVLDLTHGWAGPYATMMLGDLGADVIKIESFGHPDGWRNMGVGPLRTNADAAERHLANYPANPFAHPLNTSGSFNAVNRNKRSICLDLKSPEGKTAFLDLARDADIVIENFSPRVMKSLGLGLDALREVSPKIALVSFSAFGATGPYRDRRANGPIIEAACGWSAVSGYAGGPPAMMGVGIADSLTGLTSVATVLIALEAREGIDTAQSIDGSMLESCMAYLGDEIMLAAVTGEDPPRFGNRDRKMAPRGIFPTKGEDAWVAIAVRDDEDWQRLLSVPGMTTSGLADERFRTEGGRRDAQDEVEEKLSAWTMDRTSREVMFALQGAGVPAGSVHRVSETLDDEHLKQIGWFVPMTHPDMGTHRYNGFAWHFSRTPAVAGRTSPRLGEHSIEVLSGLLGYSAERINGLALQGVTGSLLTRAEKPAAVGA